MEKQRRISDHCARFVCNADGGINADEPRTMVADSSLLLHGWRFWRRPLRAHRAYTHMECVTAIVIFDHTTRYGGTPATVLDPRSHGHHHFHCPDTLLDLE